MVKKRIRRITAFMLSLTLFFQSVPTQVFANEGARRVENVISDDSDIISLSEPDSEKPQPAYDDSYFDAKLVAGMDFSSKRLLVGTGDPSIIVKDAEVISSYDGVYLLGFQNVTKTKAAYTYYNKTADFVEPDVDLFIADDRFAVKGASNNGSALSQLEALTQADAKNYVPYYEKTYYSIAMIDTGVSGDKSVKAVSVLGESGKDDNGHGSEMMKAVRELSPDSDVLSVKAFDSRGVGSISSVYAAMLYAIRQKASVIDLPFSTNNAPNSYAIERAIKMAYDAGIIVVGAAGNDNANVAGYLPAKMSSVYIAGACDKTGERLAESNYGENVFCNVTAESTTEAAARLSAIIAEYGVGYLEAAKDSGVLFRADAAPSAKVNTLTPCPEDKSNYLLARSELTKQTISILNNDLAAMAEGDEVEVEGGEEDTPFTQEPVSDDNVTIEHIYITWNTKSTGSDKPAGNDRLELAPESTELSNQQFQIDFSLSGQEAYPPGAIEIAFPACIWEDRYGNEYGTLELAVPEDPETGVEFAWRRDGDKIIITNIQTLPAATKYLIQGSFTNMQAQNMKDEAESKELWATITVVTPTNKKSISLTSNKIDAKVDTSVEADYAFKTATNTMTGFTDIWWNEVPKDMPEKLLDNLPAGTSKEDYGYLRWYVAGAAKGSQPFDMYVEDRVDGSYGEIMLGISNCAPDSEGNTYQLAENNYIKALLLSGYDLLPQTAYIWVAYPRDKLKTDDPKNKITIENTQTIYVTGHDDKITTKEEATGKVEIRGPIDYTFVKYWDDDNNADKKRPSYMDLKIWSPQYSSVEPWDVKRLTVDNAVKHTTENGTVTDNYWTWTWSDNGQDLTFDPREQLYNASGTLENRYDENNNELRWSYFLENYPRGEYDADTHTWNFVNKYTVGWQKLAISAITKTNNQKFADSALVSKRDNQSLNQLLRGTAIDVPYNIAAVASAAAWYIQDPTTKNLFVMEDSDYMLDDTRELSYGDVGVGIVSLKKTPDLYEYVLPGNPDGTYNSKKVTENIPDTELWGKILKNGEEEWVRYGVYSSTTKEWTVYNGAKRYAGDLANADWKSVELPEGVIGTKLQMETAGAYVQYDCAVYIRIYPTDNIKEHIRNSFETADFTRYLLFNKAEVYANYNGEETSTLHKGDKYERKTDYSYSYLHGRLYKTAAELNKSFTLVKNNTVKKQVQLHSVLELTQQTNILSLEDYIESAKLGEIPNTTEGTFYDLLPRGVDPDISSITLNSGDTLIDAWVENNYKDSGRTLLIVKVKFKDNLSYQGPSTKYENTSEAHPNIPTYPIEGYKNTHTLEFDSFISWSTLYDKSIDISDSKNFHNISAYEAKEASIGSAKEWEGDYGDLSEINNTNSSGQLQNDELGWMANLNPNNKNPSFVFAGDTVDMSNVVVTAETELYKDVQVLGDTEWSDGHSENHKEVNVHEGGLYRYRWTAASAANTITSNIILLDSLENYKPEGEENKTWKGSFVSIDLSNAKALGIVPVVYYSTSTTLDVSRYNVEANNNKDYVIEQLEKENGDWSTKAPDDLSKVTAIAVDLRHKAGDEEFKLEALQTLNIKVTMRAPYDENNPYYFNDTDGKDPENNFHAYNSISMSFVQTPLSGTDTPSFNTIEYTKVGIYTESLEVEKHWDDDDNRDGKRPDEIELTMEGTINGEKYSKTVELNENNGWKNKFDRVRFYDDNGNRINYTFTETKISGYDQVIAREFDENGSMKIILTNSHEPEKIKIPVTKSWDDAGNANKRPNEIVARLYTRQYDGDKLISEVFTGKELRLHADINGDWYGEFTDLYKYENGEEIVYNVEELPIDDYYQSGKEYDPDHLEEGFTFTNTYYPYGKLTVSKKVKNATAKVKNDEFTFTLQLSMNGTPVTDSYSYIIHTDEAEEDKTGRIGNGGTFTLKNGEWIEILDIDTKVSYIITEQSKKGYTQTEVVNDSGIIASWAPCNAEITNTYSTNGDLELDVQKVLTGHDLTAYLFRFMLYSAEVEKGVDPVEKGTWTRGELVKNGYNTSAGKVSLGTLYFSNEDDGKERYFLIEEYDQKLPGYTYDQSIFKIVVVPHDNGDGTMDCDVKYYDIDGNPVKIVIDENTTYTNPVFQNTYHAEGSLDLRAWKRIEGYTMSEDEFSFTLYDSEMKPIKTAKNNADGIVSFTMDYTEKDCGKTYRYYAREDKGDDEGIIYDTGIICYLVEVIDNNDGTLSFNQSSFRLSDPCETCGGSGIVKTEVENEEVEVQCQDCYGTGCVLPDENWEPSSSSDVPLFTNELAPGRLSIRKVVTGTNPPVEAKFNFVVTLIGDKIVDGLILQGSDGKTYTVANGTIECTLMAGEVLEFDGIPAGTIYQITEGEMATGWALDRTDNGSGEIVSQDTVEAVFINNYNPGQTSVMIVGTKYFDGRPAYKDSDAANANIFTFELVEIDENNKPKAGTKEIIYAKAGGLIEIIKTYTGDDDGKTFRYRLKEINFVNEDEIAYDKHEEIFTVKVTKEGTDVKTEVNYVKSAEDKDEEIRFENVTIPGTLTLSKTGLDWPDSKQSPLFAYVVSFKNSKGIPFSTDSINWYVKNDATGQIVTEKYPGEAAKSEKEADPKPANTPVKQSVKPVNKPAKDELLAINSSQMADTPAPIAIPTGGIGGYQNTVKWSIDESGVMTLEPMEGYSEGTFEVTGTGGNGASWAWHDYRKDITGVIIKGKINLKSGGSMFYNCSNLEYVKLAEGAELDTSQMTSMYWMFFNCPKLKTLDVSNWETGKVTNMYATFQFCNLLEELDVSKWDTRSLVNANSIFYGCRSVTELAVSGWDTRKVTNMSSLFKECYAITSLDISGWDLSNVSTMTSMFENTPITTLYMDRVKTSSTTKLADMFTHTTRLTHLYARSWKAGTTANMASIFTKCTNLKYVDMQGLDAPSLTSMQNMFLNCTKLEYADFSGSKIGSAATLPTLNGMFKSCTSLKTVITDDWDISYVKNLSEMFSDCTSLETLDASNWDVSSVTTLYNFVRNCSELTYLNISEWKDKTSNVTSMQYTFCGCTNLATIDGIEDLDLSKATVLLGTFQSSGISGSLNLSGWGIGSNGTAVTQMNNLFSGCSKIKELNLSGWDLDNGPLSSGFQNLFNGCSNLTTLKLANWQTVGVTNMNGTFANCSLKELDVTGWNTAASASGNTFQGNNNKIERLTVDAGFFNSDTITNYLNSPSDTPPYTGCWVLEGDSTGRYKYYHTDALKEAFKNGDAIGGTYVWETRQYSITFSAGRDVTDYSGSMTSMVLPCDANATLPANKFVRYGYRFAGWQDRDDNTKKYTNGFIPSGTYENNDNVILDAIWEKIDETKSVTITVEHYRENANKLGTYEDKPFKTESFLALPGDKMTFEPGSFEGLHAVKDDNATSFDKTITAVNGNNEPVKFYYERDRFTIHFEGNGAKFGRMDDIVVAYDAPVVLGNGFTNPSSIFIGWFTDPIDQYAAFYNEAAPISFKAKANDVIRLYARWIQNDNGAKFDGGDIVVYCRAGETIYITDLPPGTTYEIKEIDIPFGWSWENDTPITGSTAASTTDRTEIFNRYSAYGIANIIMHKSFEGADLLSGAFNFELSSNIDFKEEELHKLSYDGEAGKDLAIYIPGARRMEVKAFEYAIEGDGKVSVYDETGKFLGELTESAGTWSYDGIINGSSISFVADEGTVFTYEAEVMAYYTMLASNSVVDTADFTHNENNEVVTNPWKGTAPILFSGLEFTKAGTYTYYIREIVPKMGEAGYDPMIEYDDSIKTVKVIMTDNGKGTLVSTVEYVGADGAQFTNKMKKGALTVEKDLRNATGTALDYDFEFTISLVDKSGAPLSGEYSYVKHTKVGTEDSDEFEEIEDKITFTDGKATFHLKGSEKIKFTDLPHGAKYHVLELDEEGDNFAKLDSIGENGTIDAMEEKTVTFINSYIATNSLEITATKEFIGGELTDNEFLFKLLEWSETGPEVDRKYVDSDGKITFVLNYDINDLGDHVYYLVEYNDEQDSSVRYDTHSVRIEVTVMQDPETAAIIAIPKYEKSEMKFTNVALFDLNVCKEVSGELGNKTEEFNFTLELDDEENEYKLPDEITWNKGDGAERGTIPRDEASSYVFNLKHGETITFSGLPYGTKYKVIEEQREGYKTSLRVMIGEPQPGVEGDLIKGNEYEGIMHDKNTVVYENVNYMSPPMSLPGTGGMGTIPYYVGGVSLLAIGMLYYLRRRKQESTAETAA